MNCNRTVTVVTYDWCQCEKYLKFACSSSFLQNRGTVSNTLFWPDTNIESQLWPQSFFVTFLNVRPTTTRRWLLNIDLAWLRYNSQLNKMADSGALWVNVGWSTNHVSPLLRAFLSVLACLVVPNLIFSKHTEFTSFKTLVLLHADALWQFVSTSTKFVFLSSFPSKTETRAIVITDILRTKSRRHFIQHRAKRKQTTSRHVGPRAMWGLYLATNVTL